MVRRQLRNGQTDQGSVEFSDHLKTIFAAVSLAKHLAQSDILFVRRKYNIAL